MAGNETVGDLSYILHSVRPTDVGDQFSSIHRSDSIASCTTYIYLKLVSLKNVWKCIESM